MKQRSEQDIVFFISVMLGVFGAGMLLIPGRFHNILGFNLPAMLLTGLGIYGFSLANFSSIFVRYADKSRRIIRFTGVLITWAIGALHVLNGYIFVFFILFFSGLLVFAFETPLSRYVPMTGGTNAAGTLINISSFLFLYSFEKNFIDIESALSYRWMLLPAFLIASLLGAAAPFLKSVVLKRIIKRLHAIPWVMWFFILWPNMSVAQGSTTIFLAVTLVGTGAIPWDKLELRREDILGRRVLTIGNVLLLTILIFLAALLSITDRVPNTALLVGIRDGAMLFFAILTLMIYYEIATVLMTLNGLIRELESEQDQGDSQDLSSGYLINWNARLARYLKPYIHKRQGYLAQIQAQGGRLQTLQSQVEIERRRNSQMNILVELDLHLEDQMDMPVSAQMAVNTLERALNSPLVRLYLHEPENKEFMLLAAAGEQKSMLQSKGNQKAFADRLLGQIARVRKTQVIQDINIDPDYVRFDGEKNRSCLLVPMIFNGHLKGILVANSEQENAFGSLEVAITETVAERLTRAWARSNYHERLTNLIQAGSQLSAALDPAATASEVAAIAREILDARFTYIRLKLGQEGNFYQTASSGNAPNLLSSLRNDQISESLIQAALRAESPFRVRDIRKYPMTANLSADSPRLRSLLAIPIRWHRVTIGTLLAFGKNKEIFFTKNDESIAELLALQAAGAFESAWLQQELRASLRTTSLLYRLSTNIIQSETLQDAAQNIAATGHKLSKGIMTGIILFSASGNQEASIIIDPLGGQAESKHPMETIRQVMDSGQLIYISQGQSITQICVPIQTHMKKYGALWTNMPESNGQNTLNPADLQTLANQAAVALERSMLLVESRRQASEIHEAYQKLEATYDQTLAALISALDARDQDTEGHSLRVSFLATRLGEALGLPHEQLKTLERGSLLHDIGKIGISDTILHKPGPLTEEEWRIMKLHPDIGAHIVEKIPFLEDAIPLIRHHQERWNGTGYPGGLSGHDIPLLARVFAVVDAFDALTSKRPYRQSISPEEALAYLEEQSGILFDPDIVIAFKDIVLKEIIKQTGESAHEPT